MNINEYFSNLVFRYINRPEGRFGAMALDYLREVRPDLYYKVIGTKVDPWHLSYEIWGKNENEIWYRYVNFLNSNW